MNVQKKNILQFLKTIPRDKAYFIVGFSDGEGSFNTSFRKRDDFLLGWKITPVFNISQKERDILAIIKRYLGCGTIRFRKEGVWAYEVDNKVSIRETIIPFFQRFRFLSTKKQKDFTRFQKIIAILDKHKSTTLQDLQEILQLLEQIESKKCRTYDKKEILERANSFWQENREKIEKRNRIRE